MFSLCTSNWPATRDRPWRIQWLDLADETQSTLSNEAQIAAVVMATADGFAVQPENAGLQFT